MEKINKKSNLIKTAEESYIKIKQKNLVKKFRIF